MNELAWLQLATSGFTILALLVLLAFVLTGWIVTRWQYREMRAQFTAEVDRLTERFKAEYERMALEYSRMTVAKDQQILDAQGYAEQWRRVALATFTGLKETSSQAATAVSAVAEKLGGHGEQ